MAISPISADLQAAYRSVLASQTSPTTFDTDTPLTPVVVIGSASLNTSASFMKITDGTDNLDINTDGSLNVAGRSLTPLVGTRSTAGTTTLGTVGAGKKWRIYGWNLNLSTLEAAGAEGCTLLIDTFVVAGNSDLRMTATTSQITSEISQTLSPHYVEIAATKTITLVLASSNTSARATVFYEELNA